MQRFRRLSVRTSDAGYTLTELLVVLVVLGLIAAAITPQVIGRLDRSKVRAAELQLDTLGASLDLFKIDIGRYPTKDEGLRALLLKPEGQDGWDGPYVRSAKNIIDPWGTEIDYFPPQNNNLYRLMAYGADGVEGGVGDNEDVVAPKLDFGAG